VKELGFNLSKTFENQLKHLIMQFSIGNSINNLGLTENKLNLVGPPGFEPGSIAPEATSLDQTSRRPLLRRFLVSSYINVGLALNFSGHSLGDECFKNQPHYGAFWIALFFLLIRGRG
jgi:hypothetical protein